MLPEGNDRMLVETVLSRLTVVSHCKQGMHRVWVYFQTCLAFTMAAFDVLVQWQGFVPLLVAEESFVEVASLVIIYVTF